MGAREDQVRNRLLREAKERQASELKKARARATTMRKETEEREVIIASIQAKAKQLADQADWSQAELVRPGILRRKCALLSLAEYCWVWSDGSVFVPKREHISRHTGSDELFVDYLIGFVPISRTLLEKYTLKQIYKSLK